MQRSRIVASAVAVIVVAVAGYYGIHYATMESGSPLIVYSADAYVLETNHLLTGYHNATGTNTVGARGGGSFTDAREIGQGDPADAFVSVALESYNASYLGARYAGWAVAFASDQLVLAYDGAPAGSSVNSIVNAFSSALSSNSTSGFSSAYAALTSGRVKVGISNPSNDPAGLRGWVSLEIAGSLYANGNQSYYVHRLVSNGGLVNGSNAAALVAPLTTGNIQFLFIYKSTAISKNLSYVTLPDRANFGNFSLRSYYSEFAYGTATGMKHGSVIFLYASALAGDAGLSGAAMGFVLYTLNNSAQMASFGLDPLNKPILFNNTAPPEQVQQMLDSGAMISGGRF